MKKIFINKYNIVLALLFIALLAITSSTFAQEERPEQTETGERNSIDEELRDIPPERPESRPPSDVGSDDARDSAPIMREDAMERREMVERQMQERLGVMAEERPSRDEMRENAQMRAEERIKEAEEKRDVARERMAEEAVERVGGMALQMIERIENSITRLYDHKDRIEERMVRFEDLGFNMDEARESLIIAIDKIERSEEEVREAFEVAQEVLEEEDSRRALVVVRMLIVDSRESIMEAHQALVRTITLMRPGSQERDELQREEGDDEDEE